MKTVHGMFAAKPKPSSLPVELNMQIIAVSIFHAVVCLFMFKLSLLNDMHAHCHTIILKVVFNLDWLVAHLVAF